MSDVSASVEPGQVWESNGVTYLVLRRKRPVMSDSWDVVIVDDETGYMRVGRADWAIIRPNEPYRGALLWRRLA